MVMLVYRRVACLELKRNDLGNFAAKPMVSRGDPNSRAYPNFQAMLIIQKKKNLMNWWFGLVVWNPKVALWEKGAIQKGHHNSKTNPNQTTNSWLLIVLFMEKPMVKRDTPILRRKKIVGSMDCLEKCTRWSPCCLLFNRTVSCKFSLQPTSHQQLKNLYNPFNLIPFLDVPFNLPFKLNHQLPILELNYPWIPVVMSSQVLSSISIIFRQLKYVTWSKILRGYPRYSISGENHLPGEFADKKYRIQAKEKVTPKSCLRGFPHCHRCFQKSRLSHA